MLYIFILSIIMFSVGVGISIIGFTDFEYIDDINNEVYIKDEIFVEMQKDLIIQDFIEGNIEFIEEERNDIGIVYKHHNLYNVFYHETTEQFHIFNLHNESNNIMNFIRKNIEDINNKKIINYEKKQIYICTSKKNIEILKSNINKYVKMKAEEYSYYNELREENNNYKNRVYELEELRNSNFEIENLKTELENIKSKLSNN